MNLLETANKFPPVLCRFCARKKHGTVPMSHRDIALASGLSKSKVATLSKKRSWNGVPIDMVVRFSAACGVHLHNPKRAVDFLRRRKKSHVLKAKPAQQKFFAEIFRREPSATDQNLAA